MIDISKFVFEDEYTDGEYWDIYFICANEGEVGEVVGECLCLTFSLYEDGYPYYLQKANVVQVEDGWSDDDWDSIDCDNETMRKLYELIPEDIRDEMEVSF